MRKPPSPCIDVCKFKRAGHCTGCAMTKAQKRSFKALDTAQDRLDFLEALTAQQHGLGKYKHWPRAYTKKLRKRGIAPYAFL